MEEIPTLGSAAKAAASADQATWSPVPADHTIRQWRQRAHETRLKAMHTRNFHARETLLNLASEYDHLAEMLERVTQRGFPPGGRLI